MNDHLEDDLKSFLSVDPRAIDRVCAGVARRRSARPRRLFSFAGAALAVLSAWGLWSRAQDGEPTDTARVMLDIRRVDDAPRDAYYTPPTFAQAVAASDWVVRGSVVSLTGDSARFEIDRVIVDRGRSSLNDGADLEFSRGLDRPIQSDRRAIEWPTGKDVWLALFRDPEDGIVKPTFAGSGVAHFPLGGILLEEDFEFVFRRGPLSVDRLRAYISLHGPSALSTLRQELHGLRIGEVLPARSEPIQEALALQLETEPDRWREYVRHLSPETLRARPEELLRGWVRAAVVDAEAADSPHTKVAVLEPFARAGREETAEVLERVASRAEQEACAKPGAYGWSKLLLRAASAWWHVAPELAAAATWERYAHLPAHGLADQGHALELLRQFGDTAVHQEIIRRSLELFEEGEPVWLDLLATSREPDARELFYRILEDEEYSLGLNRYRHRPAHAIRSATVELEFDAKRMTGLVEARLQRPDLGPSGAHDWILILTAAGLDIRTVGPALAPHLERIKRADHNNLQLVLAVEQSLRGHGQKPVLPYRNPTDDEIARASQKLAAELRSD